jgi:hypothetical protein
LSLSLSPSFSLSFSSKSSFSKKNLSFKKLKSIRLTKPNSSIDFLRSLYKFFNFSLKSKKINNQIRI